MPDLSTQRISTILGYKIEGEEDLQALAQTLGRTNEETEQQTENTEQLTRAQKKNLAQNRDKALQSRRARTNQINMNRAMEEARDIIRDNTLRLENLKLEYEQGNLSAEEYRFELQKLMNQMESLDVPMTAVPRRMRQINKEMKSVSGASGGLNRNMGRASFTFNSFAQILQDLPFGLVAISNNIPQAATGFSQLSGSAGGAAGAFKELLGFIKGPGGWLVVAGTILSVLATLIPKMDLFGKKTKEAAEANEALGDAVKSGIGDFIGDLSDRQQIEVIENAIDQLLKVDELPQSYEEADNQLQGLIDSLDKAAAVQGQFVTAQSDATAANVESNQKALDFANKNLARQNEMNDLILEELNRRLAIAKANELVAKSLRELGLEQEKLSDDELSFDTPIPEGIDEMFDPEGDAVEKFEERIDRVFGEVVRTGTENFETLALNEQYLLDRLSENVILNEYEKERLRTQITERFAERRNQIEERNAERIMNLQDRVAQSKAQTVEGLVGTISAVTQTLFQDSKAAAIAGIAIEKGFAITKILINGIQEAARLTMLGTANLVTPGFQGLGAAQLTAAGKIKTIAAVNAGLVAAQGIAQGAQAINSIDSGGEAGGRGGSVSYRNSVGGFEAGSDFQGRRPAGMMPEFPKELVLKDKAGKVLTKLEQARAREGGTPNLVEGNNR